MKLVKKILASILMLSLLMVAIPSVYASNDIKVVVDDRLVEFDTPPCLIGGRTMVPLRAIFEALDVTISWDQPTQTVTAFNEAYLVKCTIGNNDMYVNNVKKTMDIAPMIIENRTLVPARFIAEAFACDVEWDSSSLTVNIRSKSIDYSTLESESPTSNNAATPESANKLESKVETKTETPPVISNTVSSKNEGTIQNPYSASSGKTITYQRWSSYPQKKVSIKCTKVIRGATANSLADSENRFNDKPSYNQEWYFMEFDVKYISATGSGEEVLKGSDIIYKDTFFTASGSSLNVADMATLGSKYKGYGVFDTELYPGGTGKVVIGILINKNAGDILLRVPDKSSDSNSWIKCTGSSNTVSTYDEDDEEDEEDEDYYYDQENNTQKNISYYSGTTLPTYTSVTGTPLKTISSKIHIYEYNKNDFLNYMSSLYTEGWTEYEHETKGTRLTYYMMKGSKLVSISYSAEYSEVWIIYQ